MPPLRRNIGEEFVGVDIERGNRVAGGHDHFFLTLTIEFSKNRDAVATRVAYRAGATA